MARLRTWGAAGAAGIALVGLLACGEGAPEEQLREAQERLRGTEAQLEESRQEVEAERAELEQCRQELADAKSQLAQARQKRSEAEDRVEEKATDVAIFRIVQSALLEAEELASAAIRADVDGGVVTLRGSVQEASARERAGALARETPGVTRVENQIEVAGGSEGEGSRAASSEEEG
jgi:osmotically-inducible protein OsmY